MALPPNATSSIVSRPVDRPATASTLKARTKPAFRLRFDGRMVDCYDVSKAPAAALKAAGLEPGFVWLPRPYEFPAVAGVNGVWCDVDGGWKTEDILAKGYPALTDEERESGVTLLDAWVEVPKAFTPEGQDPGPVLRVDAVQGGYNYHTPWTVLHVHDRRQDAREIHDSALQACWIAWMVREGHITAAYPATVQGCIQDAQNRVSELSLRPGVTPDNARLLTEKARAEAMASAKIVTAKAAK